MGPGIIAAGVTGIGNVINSLFQGGQNRKNREFQREENEKSRQFSLDMWNRQNEYNLPTNQMSRLRDAGINPHLAYSNGAPMNTSNAPASPTGIGSLPPGEASKLNLGEIFNAILVKSQVKNIDADTAKKQAEKEQVEAQTTGIGKDNQLKDIDLTYKEKQIVSQLGMTEQQVKESQSRIETAMTQNEKVKQEIDNLKSSKKLTEQQTQNLVKTLSLISAQTQQILADADLKREQRNLTILQKGNVEAQTRKLTEEVGLLNIDSKYRAKQLDAAIKEAYQRIKESGVRIDNVSFQQVSSIIGSLMNVATKGNTMLVQP
uniref:DNA pilot protein n=1 Tax=Dulem virus 208 TaxID=3145685 RepID=A0AAU8BA33_9VIRU